MTVRTSGKAMTDAHASRTRRWEAIGIGTAALVVVAMGALLAGPTGGRVVGLGESFSGSASSALQGVGTLLPLGYAFAAGMVAAVNPCGFSLLPAYLGLYLGDRSRTTGGNRVVRALLVSATVTASFVVMFGMSGLLISATRSAVGLIFPWLGLVVGLLLIAAGSYLVAGGTIYTGFGDRIAQRFGTVAVRPGLSGYAAYGFAYGLASLGCTLPIFLSVIGGGFVSSRFWVMALQFVLYGLGLGVVLSALTLIATLFDVGLLRKVQRLGRFVPVVSALLLLVTGAYVSYYWLTAGGVLESIARAG